MGEGLRHSGYRDFNASELCPGSDPDPRPVWVPGRGIVPVTSARLPCEQEGGQTGTHAEMPFLGFIASRACDH